MFLVFKNYCWNEFQGFCKSNHLWAIIMLSFAWWRHQNKEICIYLNGDFLFYKLSMTWISRFLLNNHVIKIRKFMFVWMLNASVYFINCCWREFQGFCRKNHLWAFDHVDSFCVMTYQDKVIFVFPLYS